jgi:hypothetical protein
MSSVPAARDVLRKGVETRMPAVVTSMNVRLPVHMTATFCAKLAALAEVRLCALYISRLVPPLDLEMTCSGDVNVAGSGRT